MRSLAAAFTVAALGTLLAACGTTTTPRHDPTQAPTPQSSPSSSPTAPPSPTATSSPTPAQTLASCTTADLTGAAVNEQGAAGSIFFDLKFTNVGSASCTLFGNPGVSMVAGSQGAQVGAAATFVNRSSATTMTLAPGGSAIAILQVAEAGNFPDSACGLETVAGLRVYPPGQTAALFLPVKGLQGCRDSSAKLMQVGPVQS
jgi:hypothetical protein